MSVTTKTADERGEAVINIKGRFDFAQQKEFRNAYKDIQPGTKVRIELSDAEYMDSAALGMLLLLKEHVGEHTPVVLERPSEGVQKILRVANFDKIFAVE